jgi:hypothetical protein
MNLTSGNCCIILEKVEGTFHDAIKNPPSLGQVELVVAAVAKLHSKWLGADLAERPECQFILRSNASPYKMLSGVADSHFNKVCAKKQGGEGWTYTMPADLIELWPDIKVSVAG